MRDHSGSLLLVYLWATWDPPSQAGLEKLHAAKDAFADNNLRVHALAMDGPREASRAVDRLEALFPGAMGGRSDRRTSALIELILQSTLGTYDDVALPLGLLMDADGQLVSVHMGSPDVPSILEQARRLRDGDPRDEGRWSHALTGGRWLFEGPTRNFTRAIEYLAEERGEERRAGRRHRKTSGAELRERKGWGEEERTEQ